MKYITLLLLLSTSCTTTIHYHLSDSYFIIREYGYDRIYEVDTIKCEMVSIEKERKLFISK